MYLKVVKKKKKLIKPTDLWVSILKGSKNVCVCCSKIIYNIIVWVCLYIFLFIFFRTVYFFGLLTNDMLRSYIDEKCVFSNNTDLKIAWKHNVDVGSTFVRFSPVERRERLQRGWRERTHLRTSHPEAYDAFISGCDPLSVQDYRQEPTKISRKLTWAHGVRRDAGQLYKRAAFWQNEYIPRSTATMCTTAAFCEETAYSISEKIIFITH